jgi:hypothetical protein
MNTQTFNMAATAEAFNILSSSLYSNPKLAIIRELSTNANDAHKQAGKEDYPFNLHLPTPSEPFFNIRDYGDGIPEDLIYNIYTSYFVSTKVDDENQTGCFGLGSKTPFSLVDEYEVISYCEGKKKTYKMSKKNGLPCVEKIAEEDWTKDTGLEINFRWVADREWHYDEWNDEANKFFRSTNFMPNVNTFLENQNFNWDEFMADREFHSFDSIDIGRAYSPNLSVNVAGVGFEVRLNDLKGKGDILKDIFEQGGVKRINIMANKSDVTLTPSREVLHYDDKTINFIYDNAKKVVDEYYQKLNDNFDEFTYKDALNLQENQKYDHDLNDKFRAKVFNTFFQKALDVRCSGKGKSITVCSPNDLGGWRGRPNKVYLVDFNGIKSTVKQNVVDNFLALQTFDDKGKLTSTSFADVVKRIRADDVGYRVLFPKNYKDANNMKLCKEFLGDDVEVVNWATACEYKKEAGSSGRKLGFKTRQTICYDSNGNYRYGYNSSPDLRDDEIGVLATEGIDLYYVRDKAQVLKDLGITFNLVVRPCKESVYKKYKEKGFLNIEEYVKTIVDANIDTIRDEMIVAKKNDFVKNWISYGFEADLAEVFNDPAYDSLMDIEDFKNIRELYKEENYTTNFHRSFTSVKGIDGVPDYPRPMFEQFPLFSALRISTAQDWRNFFDYMLLYKNSSMFQMEKKIVEEVA